VARTAH